MKLVIITVQPHGYPHWQAFDELADSLVEAADQLGHDVERSSMPIWGRRSIILGSNLLDNVIWEPPPDSILYNLEQIDPNSPWIHVNMLARMRHHIVWDYSDYNAARYSLVGLPPPRAILPVGYSPSMERINKVDPTIDVFMYGSFNERRMAASHLFDQTKLGSVRGFNVYGEKRDDAIAQCRLVLNVHYYQANIFEIVRCSYLMANRIPIVSEESFDQELWEAGVSFVPYNGIARRVASLLDTPDVLHELGEAGYELIKSRPQKDYLRAALETL